MGNVTALAISEKEHYSFNPMCGPPAGISPAVRGRNHQADQRRQDEVVNTLGLRDGISHAEYRVRDGIPYLIEVAARGGGNRIASVIIKHVSGVDVYEMLIHCLMGQDVRMPSRLSRAANLEFLNFPPGKVKAIFGLEEIQKSDLVCDMELHFSVGETIKPANDDKSRQGYFISLGETRDEIDEKARRVKELLKIEYV